MKKFTLLALITTFAGTAYQLSGVTVLTKVGGGGTMSWTCPSADLMASYRDWKQTVASGTFANLSSDLTENEQDLTAALNNVNNIGSAIAQNSGSASICTVAAARLPSYCCSNTVGNGCYALSGIYLYQSYMYYLWLAKKGYGDQYTQAAQQLYWDLTTNIAGSNSSSLNILDACAAAVPGN